MQSILGRITQMARANINAMLDRATDPKVMVDQMVRDYTASIEEAEDLVAQTIGNLRGLEEDAKQAQSALTEWGDKAKAASTKAEELKRGDDVGEANKFDDLARIAISKQIQLERDVSRYNETIAHQSRVVEELKEGLSQMHLKLHELKSKRQELVGRAKVAEAQGRVQDVTAAINAWDPTSEIAQYEEMIRKEEAQVRGRAELVSESVESRFAELADSARDAEVERRLAALK